MNNRCPKCGEKLSVFYLKQNCPNCGVNLLYYKMDEQLQADAEKAQQEVEALWRTVRKLDKAHLVEKYCRKKGRPLPWAEDPVEAQADADEVPNDTTD